jgi:DUF4097 and DUF4098 domain-containing protein YvlB
MQTFITPEPIAVTLALHVGDVHIEASDRADTEVEVVPATNSAKSERMARETTVELVGGRLRVQTPKHLATVFGNSGKVTIRIALPRGSSLEGDTALGELHVTGDLGECRYKTGYGAIHLDQVGALRLRTGAGDITVDHATGDVDLSTGSGELRLGQVEGTATLKTSNGNARLGEAKGPVSVRTANGYIVADRVTAGLQAKSANGDLRVGEAAGGSVDLKTAAGKIDVGIPEGTAAWLDLQATSGRVHNGLGGVEGPAKADKTVEVRARTYYGDIRIHRS